MMPGHEAGAVRGPCRGDKSPRSHHEAGSSRLTNTVLVSHPGLRSGDGRVAEREPGGGEAGRSSESPLRWAWCLGTLFPCGTWRAGMPARPDHRHDCQDPTASTERSGNRRHGSGREVVVRWGLGRYRRRGGARGDRGELRVRDDGRTVPSRMRRCPGPAVPPGADRLVDRIGGGRGEGKDLQGTFGGVTGRDGGGGGTGVIGSVQAECGRVATEWVLGSLDQDSCACGKGRACMLGIGLRSQGIPRGELGMRRTTATGPGG